MNDLLLHATTKRHLESFVAEPSHALIIVGPIGSGKSTLATRLAEIILHLTPGSYAEHAYSLTLAPVDDKAIGVEAIRELEHFLSLKVPGTASFDRAVIIESAHRLTNEAQNALLKTLEEPPAGTILILTANHAQALLPTIRSRAQAIAIKAPEQQVLVNFYKTQGIDPTKIAQAYSITGGLPGLMSALLNNEDHPLLAATQKARQLLGGSTYERLLLVDELAKQKTLAADTLFILGQMAHVSLRTATGPAAAKWQGILEASYATTQKLSVSAQPKLALTNLMLSL